MPVISLREKPLGVGTHDGQLNSERDTHQTMQTEGRATGNRLCVAEHTRTHACPNNVPTWLRERVCAGGSRKQWPDTKGGVWRVKGMRCCADTENDVHVSELGEVAVARRQSACDLIAGNVPECGHT